MPSYPIYVGCPDACDRRAGNPSAPRAWRTSNRREVDLFVGLFPPPWDGLHGGLLEGSCGRRRRGGMPNLQNVGESAYPAQNMKILIRRRCDKQLLLEELLLEAVALPICVLRNVVMCA